MGAHRTLHIPGIVTTVILACSLAKGCSEKGPDSHHVGENPTIGAAGVPFNAGGAAQNDPSGS